MNILALDCATKTGWATSTNGTVTESGVQDFTKQRGDSNGIMFLRFRRWLAGMCDDAAPDVIAYERAHYRGGAATEVCVGLTTRVQEAAAGRAGCECITVPTMTLKKHATGHGNASKGDMIVAAAAILGREPIDDNEADAVLIAAWAWGQVGVGGEIS